MNIYIDTPPEFVTDPEHLNVLNELIQREPIFHHPEFGTTREDFENMTDAAFWEVGASGRRYNREYTLAEVVKRYENPHYRGIYSPPENAWQTKDFHCREIANNTYLLTYTLVQEDRVTRRLTLWQRSSNGWKILYHQGTIVQQDLLPMFAGVVNRALQFMGIFRHSGKDESDTSSTGIF